MTLAVFTFSLLGAMALGMPIAFALIVCGIALMHSLDTFDSQIVAQNIINGADSFPLMAVPFFMLKSCSSTPRSRQAFWRRLRPSSREFWIERSAVIRNRSETCGHISSGLSFDA